MSLYAVDSDSNLVKFSGMIADTKEVSVRDYSLLLNKPEINGVVLEGNLSLNDIGAISVETDPTVPTYVKEITEEDILNWNSKASANDVLRVESIAKGANQSLSFNNYSDMILTINNTLQEQYNVGQNLMIVTLNVPDLWISGYSEEYIPYTYVTDDYLVEELKTSGSVQMGYYYISMLETQKVNLIDYVKNTDYATSSTVGLIKANSSQGFFISSTGDLSIVQATDNDIANRTNKYRPITANNLDPAVNSVLKERVVLTQIGENEYSLDINTEV